MPLRPPLRTSLILLWVDLMLNISLPCVVDPDRKHVFTGTISNSYEEQQLRQCNSKERFYYVGTNKRARHVENLKWRKGTKQREACISSAKTVDIAKIEQHGKYMSDHVDQSSNDYNKSSAPFRFYDYQEK